DLGDSRHGRVDSVRYPRAIAGPAAGALGLAPARQAGLSSLHRVAVVEPDLLGQNLGENVVELGRSRLELGPRVDGVVNTVRGYGLKVRVVPILNALGPKLRRLRCCVGVGEIPR